MVQLNSSFDDIEGLDAASSNDSRESTEEVGLDWADRSHERGPEEMCVVTHCVLCFFVKIF